MDDAYAATNDEVALPDTVFMVDTQTTEPSSVFSKNWLNGIGYNLLQNI